MKYIFEEKCKLPDGGNGNLLLKNSVVGWERLGLVEFSAKLLLV